MNSTSKMRYECDRVKVLVKDAIKRFFWEEQRFKTKFSIDALIGVTIDDAGMFYVSLNEVVDRDSLTHDVKKHVQQKTPCRKRPHHAVEGQTSLMMECSVSNNQEEPSSSKSSRPVDRVTNCIANNMNTTTEQFQDESSTKTERSADQDDPDSIVIKQEIDDSWETEPDDSLSSSFPHYTDVTEAPSVDNSGMPEPSSNSKVDLWTQESQRFRGVFQKPTNSPGVDRQPEGTVVPPVGSGAGGDQATTPPGDIVQLSFPEGYQGPLPLLPHTISGTKEQRRRSILPLAKKVELIQRSKGLSSRKLAEIFNVSKSQVQSILRRREEIMVACADGTDQSKKLIADRQCKMQDVNRMTWTWYKDMMASKLPVSGPLIQRQAMYFAQLLGKAEFKASNGWLQSFKQRHRIGGSSNSSSSAAPHGEIDVHNNDTMSRLGTSQAIAGDTAKSGFSCKQEVPDLETIPEVMDDGGYAEDPSEGRNAGTADPDCDRGDSSRKQFSPSPEYQNLPVKSSEISNMLETLTVPSGQEVPEISTGHRGVDNVSVSRTSDTQTTDTQVEFTEYKPTLSTAASTTMLHPTVSSTSPEEPLSASCQSAVLQTIDTLSTAKGSLQGHMSSANQTLPATMAHQGGYSDLSGGTVLGMGGLTEHLGSSGTNPMPPYPHYSGVSSVSVAPHSAGGHGAGHSNISCDYSNSGFQDMISAFNNNMFRGYSQGAGVLGVTMGMPSSTTETHVNNKHIAFSVASSSIQNSICNPVDDKLYTGYQSVVPGFNAQTTRVESDVLRSSIPRHQMPNSAYTFASGGMNTAIGVQGQGHLDSSICSSSCNPDNLGLCGAETKSSSNNVNT